jgi:predicted enzyme related to lactoylglutathione lyase
MGNQFVHVELMATDVGKAKSFYGELFDWNLEDMNMGDMTYTIIKVGEGTGGGLMKNPIPNAPSMWVAYVDVNDLQAATSKAKSLGAKVMKDNVEVKDMAPSASSPTRRERCWAFGRRRSAEPRHANDRW